jgi:hypothetical protein
MGLAQPAANVENYYIAPRECPRYGSHIGVADDSTPVFIPPQVSRRGDIA